MASNTTPNLIADIELLRQHLEVDRWLVLGGSWGSVLALAYAERYPGRVTEMILWGVTTGRRKEFGIGEGLMDDAGGPLRADDLQQRVHRFVRQFCAGLCAGDNGRSSRLR